MTAPGSRLPAPGSGPQAPAATRTPSFATAALRVFDLSLGEMLWSRRSVFLALVVGAPVVIAVIFRVVELLNMPAFRVNGTRLSGAVIFGMMIWWLYLWFIVPILGVFYGTALMADEVEEKTITYLFTRPIPRGAVLVGKYLAYLAVTTLIVLPSVLLVYFLVVPIGGGSVAGTFLDLLKDLALIAAGLATYGALFALVGAQLKRPLLTGLFFAFGWEQFVMLVPGYLRRFSVAYYLQSLVPQAMPSQGVSTLLQSFFKDNPSLWTCLAGLTVILVVSLALATRAVERREYVLEQ
jgi:ABC-type transport system involved in multi-copper enzyme maturation permease subunit